MAIFIMAVLVVASITGLTFIIERGLALQTNRIIPRSVQEALENYRNAEDLPMMRRICQQNPSPLSRLLLLAYRHRGWNREENASALETNARHEVSKLERGLVVLEIVVGVAPLLGLVGTIYGLIILFLGMGQADMNDNSRLAEGIALALRATLLGLLTAIPSLIAWSYFTKKVENLAIEMASLCDAFLRRQYHREVPDEVEEERDEAAVKAEASPAPERQKVAKPAPVAKGANS